MAITCWSCGYTGPGFVLVEDAEEDVIYYSYECPMCETLNAVETD